VALLAALVAATPAAAKGELRGEVQRVLEAWRASGARVVRLETLFLERDQSRVVELPPLGTGRFPCLTVQAMAERGLSFALAESEPDAQARDGSGPGASRIGRAAAGRVESQPSSVAAVAGLARLSRCGHERDGLRSVRLGMRSPRGAVEVLVAAHAGELSEVAGIVPERAVGPVPPRADIGPALRPAPLAERLERAIGSARSDGATVVVPVRTPTSDEGSGSLTLRLGDGCHRLAVLGGGDGRFDLDAELRLASADEPLGQDRSHAPDARLELCLGESSQVELRFVGAGGGAPVTVVDARWPLPSGFSAAWGPQTRAGLGWALFRHRAPPPRSPPVLQVLGGPGSTFVPVELEPGSCYLAAMAQVGGTAARASRLAATVGGVTVRDDVNEAPHAAAVSFCAGSHRRARLQADLRARGGWWHLALWRAAGRRR